MKAIVIDPVEGEVTRETLPAPIRNFTSRFVEPRQVGRLPNGDVVWAGTNRIDRRAFSVGGGKIVVGTGLVVGPKDDVGDFTDARSSVETIRQIVRFSELPGFEVETTPERVTPEIEKFARELASENPTYVPVDPVPGSRRARCWENVGIAVRRVGGERVYGWTIWERPGLFLTAEFHAVWRSAEGELVDPTPKADGEEQIMFCAASAGEYPPSTFDFRLRPSNRRFRLYRNLTDGSAIVNRMSSGKKSYESRKARKLGIPLSALAASKVPLDDLEAAIERLFEICTQIDRLVDVGFEGLTSKHPDRVAALDAEKSRTHERILELAREKLGNDAPLPNNAYPRR